MKPEDKPGDDKGVLHVRVTSTDGNLEHPFKPSDTVGTVRTYAYEKLVQDRGATPFGETWIDFGTNRVGDDRVLSSFPTAPADSGHGKKVDLVLALSWIARGG